MDPVAFSIGPFEVRWYAICILVGILAAGLVARHTCKKLRIDTEHIINMLLFAVVFGIIGARAYYVLFRWSYYSQHLNEIYRIWEGGLAIHGGLIVGILTIFIYAKVHNHSFRKWLDIWAPGVILAQGIGRWGNFFNQEAYGFETDVPWAMFIDGAYRHPTFLYESIWDVLGFILLFILSHGKKHKIGDIAAGYFIWYSCGRFVIEWFRTDSLLTGGGLKAAMIISIIGVVAGILLLIINRKMPVTDISAMQKPIIATSKKQKKHKK